MLDPAREDYTSHMPAELREIYDSFDAAEAAATFEDLPDAVIQLYRDLFTQELAGWAADVLIDYHVSPRGLKVGGKWGLSTRVGG